jgi:hypothetical protein
VPDETLAAYGCHSGTFAEPGIGPTSSFQPVSEEGTHTARGSRVPVRRPGPG